MEVDTATINPPLSSFSPFGRQPGMPGCRLLFLSLSLYGCTSTSHAPWHCRTISGATEVIYEAQDSYREMEFQLLTHCGETRGSLHLLCIPLSSKNGSVTVVFSWEGHKQSERLTLMTGGQVLVLPQPLTETLIDLLKRGISVEAQVGRYHTTIHSNGFLEACRHTAFLKPD